MQVANDYERDVFNGDLGIVTAVDTAERALTVSFDGRPKALAMAVRNNSARRRWPALIRGRAHAC